MKPQIARLVNQAEMIFAIDSETADTSYRVNLKQASCTCPHFVHRLAGKPAAERICKHQRTVAGQAPFILAALKAKRLNDQQLVAAIQHYQTTEKQHVAGACRCEVVRRKQAAAKDAELRGIFS